MKIFELTEEQEERFKIWKKGLKSPFTFKFTPTGIGVNIEVSDSTGVTIDLTNYEEW